MDPVLSKLNQVASQKINQGFSTKGLQGSSPSSFQTKLDTSFTDKLLEKMSEDRLGHASEVKALSADDIQITTKNKEVDGTSAFSPTEKYFSMFKDLNKDMLSLDSVIDVLSNSNVKLSPRELLKIQATVSNFTVFAEGFSKFTDIVQRSIQTIVNTQVQ